MSHIPLVEEVRWSETNGGVVRNARFERKKEANEGVPLFLFRLLGK
jgi:hypothetical protein